MKSICNSTYMQQSNMINLFCISFSEDIKPFTNKTKPQNEVMIGIKTFVIYLFIIVIKIIFHFHYTYIIILQHYSYHLAATEERRLSTLTQQLHSTQCSNKCNLICILRTVFGLLFKTNITFNKVQLPAFFPVKE